MCDIYENKHEKHNLSCEGVFGLDLYLWRNISEGGGRMSDVVLILNLNWELIRRIDSIVYLRICVFVYICIDILEGGGRMSDVVLILNLHWEVIRRKGIHSIDNFRNGTHKSWVHLTKLSLDFLQNNWLNWISRFSCSFFCICILRILYL